MDKKTPTTQTHTTRFEGNEKQQQDRMDVRTVCVAVIIFLMDEKKAKN